MALKKLNILTIFLLGASLLMLYMAFPRFLAELMLVPGTPIVERLNSGGDVSVEDLDIAQNSREQAVSFVDHPKAYSDLATVFLARATVEQDRALKTQYTEKAIESLEKTLSLAPLNTFAWLRLSFARLRTGGDDGVRLKALEAWHMSVTTAPFEPYILLSRLHLGIVLYDEMTEEDISLLQAQAQATYKWNRGLLRQYVREKNLAEWCAFLLEANPEAAKFIAA
ncbi:hypothetical protein [Kordiimonas pumila]|uniref:Tetratricopeptide repeat protein n=1 Tax=Kordiimonas pumila TaxID=2161677 RepID=A0ABV7D4W6_9PROT|nr:hypothetical protein [Kordiimonas pumila]